MSVPPALPPTRQGVEMTCETGHTQRIYTPDHTEIMAAQLAGLLDGTGLLQDPRNDPEPNMSQSMIGRCQICGAWFRAKVFGYEDKA